MPDEDEKTTLGSLIDYKIAIEFLPDDNKMKNKNEAIKSLWEHIFESAEFQAQWNISVPAKLFVLETEILKERSHLLKINNIKKFIEENGLGINDDELDRFLT